MISYSECGTVDHHEEHLEHQVEFNWLTELIVGDGRSDVEFFHCSRLLLLGRPIQLGDDVLTLRFSLCGALLIGAHLLQGRLDEVIQPEALSIFQVLHHQVGKALNVSRGCQDRLRCQHRAIHLFSTISMRMKSR